MALSKIASSTTLPQGVSQEWLSRVQDEYARSEYKVKWQEARDIDGATIAWQANNRSNNLRAYFLPKGMHVAPGKADNKAWKWGLRLACFGTDGAQAELRPPVTEVTDNKITYDRGVVKEWYINTKEGIEQGFTIISFPSSGEASSRLVLGMKIEGDLKGTLNSAKDEIGFSTIEGLSVMSMSALKVYDANGRLLPSYYRLNNDEMDIIVDAGGAAYPIVVDPMLSSSPSWKSTVDFESCADSLASAGDVNGDGYSDIIIGRSEYENGNVQEGAAFIHYGSASGLSSTPSLIIESNKNYSYFGNSVACAGDVNGDGYSDVIIGANNYENGEQGEGAAFVYYGSASGLNSTPAWTVESDSIEAGFGSSVACAGDVNGDGYSDVIVGAPDYYTEDFTYISGRAYVYYGSESGLSTTADWITESPTSVENEYFEYGCSVAGAGDVNGDGYSDVIVGSYYYDNNENNEGAAYVYYGSASGLNSSPAWSDESDQEDANYGLSVAGAGDVNGDGFSDIIVGAPFYGNGEAEEGKVYVYYGSSHGPDSTPDWTMESNVESARFGMSVASAGDVNNDGYSDVIIGAGTYDNVESNEGRAYIYYGSEGGLSTTTSWTYEPDVKAAWVGFNVAGAGDVNGDGFQDIIVGGANYNTLVFYGSILDTDSDGMDDNWEETYFDNIAISDGTGDYDSDNYTDLQEYQNGTDPTISSATDDDSDTDDGSTDDSDTSDDSSRTSTNTSSSDDGGDGGGGGIFGAIGLSDVIGYHLDMIRKDGTRVYMPVTMGFKALKGAQTQVEGFAPRLARLIRRGFETLEKRAEANKGGLLYRIGTHIFPVLGKIAEYYLAAVDSKDLMTNAYSGTTISVSEFNNLHRQGLALAPHIVKKDE